MAKTSDKTRSVVEQAIDSILSGKVDAAKAVDSLISESPKAKEEKSAEKELPESVTLKDGDEIVCPQCGESDFEEGFVESEDGKKLNALRCTHCDLGLVESTEEAPADEKSDESEDEGLVEAEIDENDPHCPACDSTELTADMVESDGDKHMVITCNACKTKMVVAD